MTFPEAFDEAYVLPEGLSETDQAVAGSIKKVNQPLKHVDALWQLGTTKVRTGFNILA